MSDSVEYRPVPEFPGYRVGDDGTVWSALQTRGKGVGRGSASYIGDIWKLKKPRKHPKGYTMVALWRDNKEFAFLIHRLVLSVFVGPCPDGMEGCHENNCRNDNRLTNLRWDTPKENQADRIKHGTRIVGSQCWKAVIDESEAKLILGKLAAGRTGASVAREHSVSQTVVSRLKCGKTFVHISRENLKS